MSEFFSFLKCVVLCGTVFFTVFMILLALPKCALRSVALEVGKWALSGVFALLLVSPVDVIPDVVPVVGCADDIVYVIATIATARSAMGERKQRRFVEACENARLAQLSGLQTATEHSETNSAERGAA